MKFRLIEGLKKNPKREMKKHLKKESSSNVKPIKTNKANSGKNIASRRITLKEEKVSFNYLKTLTLFVIGLSILIIMNCFNLNTQISGVIVTSNILEVLILFADLKTTQVNAYNAIFQTYLWNDTSLIWNEKPSLMAEKYIASAGDDIIGKMQDMLKYDLGNLTELYIDHMTKVHSCGVVFFGVHTHNTASGVVVEAHIDDEGETSSTEETTSSEHKENTPEEEIEEHCTLAFSGALRVPLLQVFKTFTMTAKDYLLTWHATNEEYDSSKTLFSLPSTPTVAASFYRISEQIYDYMGVDLLMFLKDNLQKNIRDAKTLRTTTLIFSISWSIVITMFVYFGLRGYGQKIMNVIQLLPERLIIENQVLIIQLKGLK